MRLRLLVLAGLVVGLLASMSGSASAAFTYSFGGSLERSGEPFSGGLEANSVAIDDANGKTYVADAGRGEVTVFETSSGTQLASWNGSAVSNPPGTPAGSFGGGAVSVAANNAMGDVYVLDATNGVVDVFDGTGGYVCQITGGPTPSASECNGAAGSDTPTHSFAQLRGIAVDQATGNVYVLDVLGYENAVLDIFSAGGAYLRQISLASLPAFRGPFIEGFAVDDFNGDVYVADSADFSVSTVYVLNASGAYVGNLSSESTPAQSFGSKPISVAADDASGEVYVTDASHEVTDIFTPSGEYLKQIAPSSIEGSGTAIDQANNNVYITDRAARVVFIFDAVPLPDVTTGAASNVQPTSVTLNGTVNPDGLPVTSCVFEYGTDTSYGQSVPCVQSVGSGTSPVAVSADLSGLQEGTTYHFRLVAENANGPNQGADVEVTVPAAPTIVSAKVANLGSGTADLTAQINPHAAPSTYHFEYGTSMAYGTSVPIPDGTIAAGVTAQTVAQHVSGLQANATYHWRVVAQDIAGSTTGADHTFIYSQSGSGLPDNRAYEMVTPPRKNAALIGNSVFIIPPDVAEGGSRVTGSSIQCFGGSVGCNADRGPEGNPYLFSRTAGGWVTTPLAPSAAGLFADQPSSAHSLVSADVGTALFSVGTPPADEEDWWARGSDGSFVDLGPVSPPAQGAQGAATGDTVVTTVDLSHMAWTAGSVFLWPFDSSVGESVYEYVGGSNSAPVLVGVGGGLGSTDLISTCGTVLNGPEGRGHLGAMSADGRTVFFIAEKCASGSGVNAGVPVPANELFARIDESRTVLISGRSPVGCTGVCQSSEARNAAFVGASVDGSRVFFTSAQQLTNDASEGESSIHACFVVGGSDCNLYEYDFAGGGRSLVAASAGAGGGGPRVQVVLGISADGSHAYFVAKGVLSTAANDRGVVASDGAENLYVFERDAAYPGGHVAFIGTLSNAEPAQWTEQPTGKLVSVSPDGRFLVFTSRALLTADDTSLSGASQVFRYDAVSGVLTRISIGDRGFNDNGNTQERSPCESENSKFCSEDAGIAQPDLSVPGPVRLDPTMSHDGSFVFFESPVALAPGALNDVRVGTGVDESTPTYAQNVYEYHDGRVYLISDGKDTGNVATEAAANASDVKLIGSDATGANVFFATSDRLVPQDTDTELDYYDARICTAGDPCITAPSVPAGCLGEGCHGTPPPAPQAAGVGSVSFAGPGNLPAPAPAAVKKPAVKKKHVKQKPRKHHKRKRAKGRKAGRGVRGKKGGRS